MAREYFTYIATNFTNTVLYTGVTNDLVRRISQHKSGQIEGFTAKYRVNKLVYFQKFTDIKEAIGAEKKIKGLLRGKKIKLIEYMNPDWKDLSQ